MCKYDVINLHIKHRDDSWYTRSWNGDYRNHKQSVCEHLNSDTILQQQQ